jgi:hypothetical protein
MFHTVIAIILVKQNLFMTCFAQNLSMASYLIKKKNNNKVLTMSAGPPSSMPWHSAPFVASSLASSSLIHPSPALLPFLLLLEHTQPIPCLGISALEIPLSQKLGIHFFISDAILSERTPPALA